MQREPGCECDYERGRGTTSGREYIVAGRFVTSDASDEGVRISIPTVFQREEWKAESQPHGGEVKKATLFLLRGKRGGEAGKPNLGPELEGLAQFTSKRNGGHTCRNYRSHSHGSSSRNSTGSLISESPPLDQETGEWPLYPTSVIVVICRTATASIIGFLRPFEPFARSCLEERVARTFE